MRTRKHTTPLLSALAVSMLCASLTASISAHGIFEKYDTDGWGQPIISVLMQGLAHRDSFWEPGGADAQGNATLLASSQSNSGEMPDVLAGQREASVSGSVSGDGSNGQQGAGAASFGNGSGSPDAQQHAGVTGSGNGSSGSGSQQDTGAIGSGNGSADPGSSQGAESTGSGSGSSSAGSQQGSDVTGPSNGSSSQQGAGATGNGSNAQQNAGTTGSGNGSAGSNAQQDKGATGSGNSADSSNGQQDGGMAAPDGSNPGAGSSASGNGSGSQQNPDSAQAEPRQYAFTEVPQEYFDDALFIGDSRATGVALYSGWDNLTYYAEGGMTIYNMFQSKTAQVDGQTLTIEEALQKCSFGKIYLEIGINEMGTGTVDSFMEAYEASVAHLQELQPDAIIYVCGIMYVKQSKSESDPIFNNPAIQERNDRIAALADGEHIFYLDINEVVTDETGNLNPDYTWDEVHLLGKYDVLWLEYFSSHGIVKDGC